MSLLRRTRQTASILVVALATAALSLAAPATANALPPTAAPKFVQVSASKYSPYIDWDTPYGFAYGLTDAGDIYAWGSSGEGALGLGTSTTYTRTPLRIDLTGVVASGDRVIKVVAGASFGLALTEQGKVLAWGDNSYGQLGLGDTLSRAVPTEIPLSSFPSIGTGKKIIDITAGGGDWAMALSNTTSATSGSVYTWGANFQGQLGVTGTEHHAPQRPANVTGSIVGIAAGAASAYAFNSAGDLYSWGNNSYGQLNTGTWTSRTTPTKTTSGVGSEDIIEVAAGGYHAFARTQSGKIFAWGDGWYGKLGNNDDSEVAVAQNITSRFTSLLSSGETITALSAGEEHSIALTSAGKMLSWGKGSDGALGSGSTAGRTVPGVAAALPAVADGAPIVSIAAGDFSSYVVTSTGGVYATGVQGVLGNASSEYWEYDSTWNMYFARLQVLSPLNISLGALSGSVTLTSANVAVGSVLTPTLSGFNAGAVPSYQWKRDGSDIAGETGAGYTTTSNDAGTSITVQVSVTAENYAAGSTTSNLAAVGAVPVITTSTLPNSKVGILYMQTIAASGTGPITFSSSNLPAWLNLTSATGELQGITPDATGTYEFDITASSTFGTSSQHYSITMLPGEVQSLVIESSSPTTTVNQGDTIELTVWAFDCEPESLDDPDEVCNEIGDVTSSVTFTSSVATDVILGNRITFPTASPHLITASTAESVVGTLLIQVTPASTGGPSVAGPGIPGTGSANIAWLAVVAGVLLVSGFVAFGCRVAAESSVRKRKDK